MSKLSDRLADAGFVIIFGTCAGLCKVLPSRSVFGLPIEVVMLGVSLALTLPLTIPLVALSWMLS